jgi:hypothetical protein
VTQPWHAAPLFRSIPGHDFAGFDEPGYVKTAWSLPAEQGAGLLGLAMLQPLERETERRTAALRAAAAPAPGGTLSPAHRER